MVKRAAIARARPAGSRGYMTGTGIPGNASQVAPTTVDRERLAVYLRGQGWTAEAGVDGTRVEGDLLTDDYLKGCDFSDLPAPLANDIRAGLQEQGVC